MAFLREPVNQSPRSARRLKKLFGFSTQKDVIGGANEFHLGCAVRAKYEIVVFGKVVDALVDDFHKEPPLSRLGHKSGMIYFLFSFPNPVTQ